MFRSLTLCMVVLGLSLNAHAQSEHVLNEKLVLTLPDGFQMASPEELENDGADMIFFGPTQRSEISQQLARYKSKLSVDEYLEEVIDDLSFAWEEPPLHIRQRLKSIKITYFNIMPDAAFETALEADGDVPKALPVSQASDIATICDSFSRGFEGGWGRGSFHVLDESTGVCHNVNIFGAFVAVHVAKIEDMMVVIDTMDWPLATMIDYLSHEIQDDPALAAEIFGFIDSETATPEQKFAFYRAAANTDLVLEIFKSARYVSE